MQINRDEISKKGIVISLVKYKDYDAIVTAINESEIFSFYARGIYKKGSKNFPNLIELTYSEFSFLRYDQERLFLLEAKRIDGFQNLESIERISCLNLVRELTSILVKDNEAVQNIFPIFKRCIEVINLEEVDPYTVALIYFAKIMIVAGYQMNVNSCGRCNSKFKISGVSIRENSFVCSSCFKEEKDIKLSKDELLSLRYIFKCEEEDFARVKLDEKVCRKLLKLLNLFIKDYENISLNSLDIIESFN